MKQPLLIVHGEHDNWMLLDRVRALYDHAKNEDRELVVVDQPPVFFSGDSVTHSMPVGEQMGWVGPLVTDWVAARCGVPSDR